MVVEDDLTVDDRADGSTNLPINTDEADRTDDAADRLIDTEEAARILGVSMNTLCKARVYGGANALPFVKLGRRVRYSMRAIERHVAANTFTSTSQRCGY